MKKTLSRLSKSLSTWIFIIVAGVASIVDLIPAYASYLPTDWVKYVAIASLIAKLIQKSRNG